jgi:hypothetical protein
LCFAPSGRQAKAHLLHPDCTKPFLDERFQCQSHYHASLPPDGKANQIISVGNAVTFPDYSTAARACFNGRGEYECRGA